MAHEHATPPRVDNRSETTRPRSRASILVVEDDPAIRRGLCDALRHAGYDVMDCASGGEAVSLAIESAVDLVLLDVMLPQMSGFEVLSEVRRSQPTLPVIMVTARGGESDRVHGLSDGADDYIVKPFSIRELLARVEAVLRRSPARPADVRALRAGHCAIDLARREVTDSDGAVEQLTEREASILRYLASCRDRAVDRDELLQHVWGLNPRGLRTRTVDMHVARLREKIESDASDPSIILTVRGKGYILADSVEVEAA